MNEQRELIRLNFYPLVPQEFRFRVWRKEYRGERKEGPFSDLYRYTLPVDQDPEDRQGYWISFEPRKGFDEYLCKQDSNHKLAVTYLYHLLQNAVMKISQSNHDDCVFTRREFRRRLFFVLKDHKEGKETVWLEPYYLQLQTGGKFGFLADFKFIKDPEVPFTKEVQRLSLSLDSKYRSNRNYYLDKYDKLRVFLKQYKNKIFPLSGSVSLSIESELQEVPTAHLRTKTYVFHGDRTDTSQFRGLSDNGPLEPVKEEVVLVFIYTEEDRYHASNLFQALQGNFRDVMFKGIEHVMKLRVKKPEKIRVKHFSEREREKVIKQVKSLVKKYPTSKIMPILICDKDDSETYYYMKYQLLKENIPLQNVTRQLIMSRNYFKWAVSNIALALLAKLGGKPWKVVPSHEKSIIFGIGQAHQKVDGHIEKYFAYSVCTDSSGLYKKISVLGKSDNEKLYLKQLRKNILATISEHLDNGYNKYVLHIPFRLKRAELREINEAIKQLSSDAGSGNTDFVVIRVEPDNKYFGYAHTNSLIPFESTYLTLTATPTFSYLIWFEGLQYHRGAIYKRIPGPILVEFYWANRSLNKEERIKYLQDVLNLSGANWRGFNAKNLPISIYYCQLIARFLKEFPGELENLDDISNPWFL